jgi:hypothetical protein
MSPAALLPLLLPHVVLLPPEAPPELGPVAETCARAVAASPDLTVTRLSPAAAPGSAVADRVRAELDGAVQAYRELRLREAKEQAERAVATLEADAAGPGDFDSLLQARLRLALTHLALRRPPAARSVLEAAVRQAPDARVTDADWPPNLVAAWESARAAVTRESPAPLGVTVESSIAGIAPRVWVDGRPVTGPLPDVLPGEHVVVAAAPGHETRRLVVRDRAPQTLQLGAVTPVPEGAIPIMTVLEGSAGQVRLTLRRHGGGEATRETDVAGAPRVAREMAETLMGVAHVVANAGTGAERGGSGAAGGLGQGGRTTGNGAASGNGTGGTTSSGGSIFGRWWFWTIAGGVVTAGVLVAIGASRRDPGTDVRVGIAQ